MTGTTSGLSDYGLASVQAIKQYLQAAQACRFACPCFAAIHGANKSKFVFKRIRESKTLVFVPKRHTVKKTIGILILEGQFPI